MKVLATLLLMISATFAVNASAIVEGDKIHFQEASAWISAVYNKTLCHDGETYTAMIRQCVEYGRGEGGNDCKRYEKAPIFQPITATRTRCKRYSGDECRDYETIEYHQPTTMLVKFYDDRGRRVIREETVTVPLCD